VGVNDLLSDAPFYIAEDENFFKQQGISISFVHFDTGPEMIPPQARGDLDVGAGALSAGLYNAVARGIDIKIVADKGSTAPTYDYVPLMIRKALIDSGKVKTYSDLKGLRIGEAGKWAVQSSTVNEAMKRGGLTFDDALNVFNISNPQQVTAMANGSLDGGIVTEPLATIAVRKGIAVRFSTPALYPNQQISAILYGGRFIKDRRQVATKFMIAYLQAVRLYNDALVDGRFTGPAADKVIKIVTAHALVKDNTLFKDMYANGCNPDGHVFMDSIRKDFAFLKSHGAIPGNITPEAAIDDSFVQQAIAVLGPYKPAK
jgi:NitT/TauT family transport system substrate-binding protein